MAKKTSQLIIRIEPKLLKNIKILADKFDLSVSETIRMLLYSDLKYWLSKDRTIKSNKEIKTTDSSSDNVDIDDLLDEFEKSKQQR